MIGFRLIKAKELIVFKCECGNEKSILEWHKAPLIFCPKCEELYPTSEILLLNEATRTTWHRCGKFEV